VARHLRESGVLVFGLSDKPDEASIPLPEDARRGYRAIHRTPMKIVGQELLEKGAGHLQRRNRRQCPAPGESIRRALIKHSQKRGRSYTPSPSRLHTRSPCLLR
jgi:hypothetical protein